jgi:hypothetical protein
MSIIKCFWGVQQAFKADNLHITVTINWQPSEYLAHYCKFMAQLLHFLKERKLKTYESSFSRAETGKSASGLLPHSSSVVVELHSLLDLSQASSPNSRHM